MRRLLRARAPEPGPSRVRCDATVRSVRVLALALALVPAPACGPGSGAPREPAPGFLVQRLDGTPLRLDELRGRTVLIDFWATWCPPCELEIPELNAVHERTRELGVEVLALSVDDLPLDEVAAWIRERDVAYPVALADMDLAVAYGGTQFPFHVIVGPGGALLERLPPGYHDRAELLEALARNGVALD